jgi:hypothetical protein
VKQYLDKMIALCERLAGKVEPGVSPGSDRRYENGEEIVIGVNRILPNSLRRGRMVDVLNSAERRSGRAGAPSS